MTTKIEWATHTSNWLAGCTKVSPACTSCYAETMSSRLASIPNAPQRYWDGVVSGGRWTGRVSYDRDALWSAFAGLVNAKRPRRVFVNSMSDTFHADAPPESLDDLAAAMRGARDFCASNGHVIMLLTKRPDRMAAWQREHFPAGLPSWVWVGTTVEDQRRADERIPHLLRVDTAGVRFLSVEPMLGPVDLREHLHHAPCIASPVNSAFKWASFGCAGCRDRIGWVIAGCESGRKPRPTDEAWVCDLRDQCAEAGVPFFLKQLHRGGEVVGLPELDGRAWADVPGVVIR